jgi:hypothetical protein
MQKNYSETVKKPFSMSVRDFVKRIRQLASFLPEFPKPIAASGLSLTNLKNIIFHGMPSAWQENFVHVNMCIADITLAQMTDYLASEQIIADTKRNRANGGRGRDGRNTSNVRCTAPGRGHGYQGRGYQGRGRSSGYKCRGYNDTNNNSKNAAINDPCRYHGNAHTYGKCAMSILMDQIIGQDFSIDRKVPQAVVVEMVEDSNLDVETEAVVMMLPKMTPLLMLHI